MALAGRNAAVAVMTVPASPATAGEHDQPGGQLAGELGRAR